MTKNTNSLLAKILGIFTIKASQFSEVHIILMENTVRLKNPKQLKYVFDLKGSTIDRTVSGKIKETTTLKDINFMLVKKQIKTLTALKEKTVSRLIKTMRSDVEFLRSLNIMDYSMLIAIERSTARKGDLHVEN